MYEIKLLKLNNCKNSICRTKSHNSGIKYVIHQFLEKECRGWTSFFKKLLLVTHYNHDNDHFSRREFECLISELLKYFIFYVNFQERHKNVQIFV